RHIPAEEQSVMLNVNLTARRRALIAAASAAALASMTQLASAATVTWNNATPPGNWSVPANWTGGSGIPVAADAVVFGGIGSSTTQGMLTNEVDTDFTIASLQYAQKTNAVPAQYHTTQI